MELEHQDGLVAELGLLLHRCESNVLGMVDQGCLDPPGTQMDLNHTLASGYCRAMAYRLLLQTDSRNFGHAVALCLLQSTIALETRANLCLKMPYLRRMQSR